MNLDHIPWQIVIPYFCLPMGIMLTIMFVFRKRFWRFQKNYDRMWRDDFPKDK